MPRECSGCEFISCQGCAVASRKWMSYFYIGLALLSAAMVVACVMVHTP